MTVPFSQRGVRGVLGLSTAVLLASLVPPLLGEDFWKTKPAGTWTVEEALRVVMDSPWAHEEVVANPRLIAGTGTTLGEARRDRGISPVPRPPSRASREAEPTPSDFVTATYLVRWESARPVEEAFARLKGLGEHTSANFQAPPPRLPADRYVITVKITRPPEAGNDLFEHLGPQQLRARARLKTSRGTVAPMEVQRSGMEATAAVHFFFPRHYLGQPLLGAQRETVVFRFESRRMSLKSKFTLEPQWVH